MIIFCIGVVVQTAAFHPSSILGGVCNLFRQPPVYNISSFEIVGRFITGLGVGSLSMAVPLYKCVHFPTLFSTSISSLQHKFQSCTRLTTSPQCRTCTSRSTWLPRCTATTRHHLWYHGFLLDRLRHKFHRRLRSHPERGSVACPARAAACSCNYTRRGHFIYAILAQVHLSLTPRTCEYHEAELWLSLDGLLTKDETMKPWSFSAMLAAFRPTPTSSRLNTCTLRNQQIY